jgi:hypothetical protein
MELPIVAGDIFLSVSASALLAAPVYGTTLGARRPRALELIGFGAVLLVVGGGLAFAWRATAGGTRAAISGPAALAISIGALIQLGRVIRAALGDQLLAALVGLAAAVALTIGPFAAGSISGSLSLSQSTWLLAANPLVTTAAAAGIDLLHLDAIYRTSPLAHRGVALPAWTTVCAVYALLGLAAFGASRLTLRSPSK